MRPGLTIAVTAYLGACLWLAARRMDASGAGPTTPRGRLRELRWALLLCALAISGFGLFGTDDLPTLFAILLAGMVLVLAPGRAVTIVAVVLVGIGVYGFTLIWSYRSGDNTQVLYGAVLAGAGSWRTHLLPAQVYLFLATGTWLLWRRANRGSRLAGLMFARRPRWCLLLFPVVAVAAELLSRYWFAPGALGFLLTGTLMAGAVALVWWTPTAAADLATAGLVALGAYGIAIRIYWPGPVRLVPADPPPWFGLVEVTGLYPATAAAIEGSLLLAFGLWLVPRTIGPHARVLLRPEPDGELAGRVERLTQTRADAVDTAAAELRRVERDLHDGAQARLVALGMSLRAAEHLFASSPQAAIALVAEARETSSKALTELRDLVRGIYPPVLADRGLADAVRALALDTPIRTETDIDLPGRLDAPVESACYFAIAETLANAVKHAGARLIHIRVRHLPAQPARPARGVLRIEVTDNGTGGADPARGTGLAGIERRLGTFDGILAVSSPPGGPTMIIMEVPCALSSRRTSSC